MADIKGFTQQTGNPYLDWLIWDGRWARSDDPGGVPLITYYLVPSPRPDLNNIVTSPVGPVKSGRPVCAQLYRNVATSISRRSPAGQATTSSA